MKFDIYNGKSSTAIQYIMNLPPNKRYTVVIEEVKPRKVDEKNG